MISDVNGRCESSALLRMGRDSVPIEIFCKNHMVNVAEKRLKIRIGN